VLKEIIPEASVESVQKLTEARLSVDPNLCFLRVT